MFVSPSLSPTVPRRQRPAATTATAALVLSAAAASTATAATPPDLQSRATPVGPPAVIAYTKNRTVSVRDAAGHTRRVAWLSDRTTQTGGLALSRDGRQLVYVGSTDVWSIPVADGGRPVRLAPANGEDDSDVRWAPDGRQVLLVGGQIRRCTVRPVVGCAIVARDAVDEYGASWAPDSSRFAYIRDRQLRPPGNGPEVGDLVTVDAAGQDTQVVQRVRASKTRIEAPTPPVWTRNGLVWSVYTLKRTSGEPSRVRTRVLQPDGHVHTITADATYRGNILLPFLAAGETPDGAILGIQVTQLGKEDFRVALHTVSPTGVIGSYGIKFGFDTDFSTLGLLADGRAAIVTTSRRRSGETLSLVGPGTKGLGAPAVRAESVSAAVTYPDETRGY